MARLGVSSLSDGNSSTCSVCTVSLEIPDADIPDLLKSLKGIVRGLCFFAALPALSCFVGLVCLFVSSKSNENDLQ